MRKSLFALALSFLAISPALAQRWEPRGNEFVLPVGAQEIAYRSPGVLTVRRPGGPSVSAALFYWHDNYIYERMDSGKVDGAAKLDERGWLCQSGVWGSRPGSTPLKYTLALEPTPGGAVLHLDAEKTAPLKLSNGVWATLWLDRREFAAGQQVYARPAAHARIGRAVGGECDALLIELAEGQAAVFSGAGFRQVNGRVGENDQGFEINMSRGDFPVGKKLSATLKISFAPMPRSFPGEITSRHEPLSLGAVTPSSKQVSRYDKLELSVDLHGTWENPFNPDEVSLDAEVTTASGKHYTQPGFFLMDYQTEVSEGAEVMRPQGQGRWCVRIAATEPGPLRCKLIARDRSGTVSKVVGPFRVLPGARKGFLRQSRVDPRYLQFDNGAGFFPIGHNLPIYHAAGQLAGDAIRKMASKGENYNRWWMSNAGLGIEWGKKLGWYRQDAAARLDAMVDLARSLDCYYMLCLDTHQDFRTGGWQGNPFNARNGGPCATVSEWFTNEQARALYKKRLRYLVARWGYSPNILCWEFGNEMEGWADTDNETKIAWHREMAAYLSKLDPYRHLITTSWWSQTGPVECWQIPQMDIVQTHCYTNNDGNVAEQVRGYCLQQRARFAKPHLFGEFGIRSGAGTEALDPKGWGLHNAFWSALASGCCGIPMSWWHENYIEPLNLYFHFTAIHRFVKDLPFGTARWEPVTATSEYVRPPATPIVRDVTLIAANRWGRPEVSEFTVQPDGSINDERALQELLQGMAHKDLQNPPTFTVTYPRAGKFIVTVGRVSNSGLLRVWVDDKLQLERAFPCGEKIGKSWQYQPEWKLWESVYDEDVAVDIPAGKHRIKVENLGNDWIRVKRFVFTGCKLLDRPNLLAAALRARPRGPQRGVTIVWLQNRESDWYNHQQGAVAPVAPSRVSLPGFANGAYQVEWWNTWEGKLLRRERVQAKAGLLTLLPGAVATDLAAKIRPAR